MAPSSATRLDSRARAMSARVFCAIRHWDAASLFTKPDARGAPRESRRANVGGFGAAAPSATPLATRRRGALFHAAYVKVFLVMMPNPSGEISPSWSVSARSIISMSSASDMVSPLLGDALEVAQRDAARLVVVEEAEHLLDVLASLSDIFAVIMSRNSSKSMEPSLSLSMSPIIW